MKDKIVHHIAYKLWCELQSVRAELDELYRISNTLIANEELRQSVQIAIERLHSARKTVALLTEYDYDVDKGD